MEEKLNVTSHSTSCRRSFRQPFALRGWNLFCDSAHFLARSSLRHPLTTLAARHVHFAELTARKTRVNTWLSPPHRSKFSRTYVGLKISRPARLGKRKVKGIESISIPVIGYLDNGVQRLLYAVIDDRVHAHRHGILGENFLGRDVERNRPQIDAHAVVHAWHHEKRTYVWNERWVKYGRWKK